MKRIAPLLGCCLLSIASFCQTGIAIIPEPVSLVKGSGEFILPQNLQIESGSNPLTKQTVNFLKERFAITGSQVTVNATAPGATVRLLLNQKTDDAIGNEGYQLSVTPVNIIIKANKPAGLFYGAQTLVQLFPKEIESPAAVPNIQWKAPVVEITDYPRFGWRGLMLDVSRHFFTKEQVKQYINQMVRYKYNLLHWHLTDDEGWRVEIKSLPKLTQVGAWNVKKVGYFGTFSQPAPEEARDYGGFYTQEDIKEIVQYAKERFVNILPEVDVPGHSLSAIAAYPELACSFGTGPTPQVSSGQSIKDWGKHEALVDDNLCPSNEKVYEFVDKVVTELAQLFPFEYIHMGGDETFKTFWERSDAVKALMKKEKLKTMEEVQSYFTKRVEKIVLSKGKKFMGWDEILEGGISPNAGVMSWRGMKGGIEAAKMGHEVVMSPTDYAYIDYMQGDAAIEPRVYATLRLSKAYQFEPLPEGVNAKLIKGGQANLWTEQVYNMRHAEYMTWPRGWAIAESVWSPKEKKNWPNFFNKVEQHFDRYDVAEINYAPSVYEPIIKARRVNDKEIKVELTTEAEGIDVYYSFDNSFPDRFYPKYTEAITVPKDAVMLKIITYKGKEQAGRLISIPVEELKKRADKKV